METILLKADGIIDVVGQRILTPGAVLVRGSRIAAVGPEAYARSGEASDTVDLSGRMLMPGLIDCHNHLSLDPSLENYLPRMNDPVPELTIRAVRTMAVDLGAGVTTSRCLGDKEFLDIYCKKSVAAGEIPGPRLIVATRGIRAPHGHGFVGYPYSGVENIRQAVRENLLAGADLIKIYTTGTLKSPRGLPSYFSREEIQALVDEAHRAGVPVTTHCIGGPGLIAALETGIDVIEHGYFASEEEIEMIGKADRWLVMTPSIFFTDDRIRTLPPGMVEPHIRQQEEVRRSMAAVVRAGIKFAVGTDAMHGRLADEIKYLTDFGASSWSAVQAATVRAARVCGMESDIGSLDPGKIADIIGVEGNPLEDITALKRVSAVMKAGVIVKLEKRNAGN